MVMNNDVAMKRLRALRTKCYRLQVECNTTLEKLPDMKLAHLEMLRVPILSFRKRSQDLQNAIGTFLRINANVDKDQKEILVKALLHARELAIRTQHEIDTMWLAKYCTFKNLAMWKRFLQKMFTPWF
jgi:hypothetical protein